MTRRWLVGASPALFLVVVILLLRAGFSIAYSLATPLGEAPDEADHFAYAAYILAQGELPTGPEITQVKHPPLYYILAAAVGEAFGGSPDRGFLRANPDMAFGPESQAFNFFVHTSLEEAPWRGGVLTMRAGRLVSILAGLVLVLATYLLGRVLWPTRAAFAAGGAAFAALLPESLFISGAMSNDMLAAMWSALALWLAAKLVSREAVTNKEGGTVLPDHKSFSPILLAVLTGLSLGFAFVTKASAGSLVFVVAAALLLAAWQQSRGPARVARALKVAAVPAVLIGATAFLVAAPWLWRNWRLTGDPFGWPLVWATIDRRTGPVTTGDLVQLARGWWLSFWGKFGGAGHIALPAWFYVLWTIIGLAALIGWVSWFARRRREEVLADPGYGGWVLLLGAPLVTAAGIYSYSQIALGTDQGRLLFPALAPLALLISGGVAAWVPARFERAASIVLVAGMTAVAAAALLFGLVRPFTPPAAPTATELASAVPLVARFGPMELVAAAWDRPKQGELTLYWRAVEEITEDLRTDVRVLDADGSILWEWKRSPGAGRFSTDRWPTGRIVADTYRIPPDAFNRRSVVQVGLRPFPEGSWVPVVGVPEGQLLTLPR